MARGPVEDAPLELHPIGAILQPDFHQPWVGTPEECVEQCRVYKRKARDAIQSFFSRAVDVFPSEAVQSVMDEACVDGDSNKSDLVILAAQRHVWKSAQEEWPTIQYQFKLFSELTRELSQFLLIVFAKSQWTPDPIATTLRNHLVGLRQLAFEVRFIYQELHDLGALSKEFNDSLPEGWDLLNKQFSAAKLSQIVKQLQDWSIQAVKIVEYHDELREKTWVNDKVDMDRHPVPDGAWYWFGNPPAWGHFEAIKDLLRRKLLHEQNERDASEGVPMESVTNSGEQDSNKGTSEGRDNRMEIDSVSPSEDDRQAEAILKGGGENRKSSGIKETSRPTGEKRKATPAVSKPDKRRTRQKKGEGSSSTSMRRASDNGTAGVAQTRAGRMVKPTDRARNGK